MKKIFKALDDPTRRKILDLLKDSDLTAGEVADHFDMRKPSVSYHLDLLKQAELVVSVKKGQYVYYSLSTSVLEDIVTWLMGLKDSEAPSSDQAMSD
ncbi:autorepressor SdpR family transcription factor [uncultured Microscilla sp.]|uniref:autorepressor SdpR family transcription factor n=1 Tax=uncultured Microscilla sp. TaxID=432653 RepID=UPI002634A7B7|nr:autorepressor SdpR family transcription factor [uncultured Microscilla sp.]